jgi:hypothetical protein
MKGLTPLTHAQKKVNALSQLILYRTEREKYNLSNEIQDEYPV